MDFTNIFLLKGRKLKNKGQTNFYESCDLTKKVYLLYTFSRVIAVSEDDVAKDETRSRLLETIL